MRNKKGRNAFGFSIKMHISVRNAISHSRFINWLISNNYKYSFNNAKAFNVSEINAQITSPNVTLGKNASISVKNWRTTGRVNRKIAKMVFLPYFSKFFDNMLALKKPLVYIIYSILISVFFAKCLTVINEFAKYYGNKTRNSIHCRICYGSVLIRWRWFHRMILSGKNKL